MRRDINFFTPYLGREKQQKNKHIYIYTLVGALAIMILGTLGYNSYKIYSITKAINDLETELNAPEIVSKVKESEIINKDLDILGRYDTGINQITEEINTRDLVSTKLLNSISSTLPTEVSFKNINVTAGNISISASSTNRTAIAEVQHNLKALQEISDVYIGAISSSGEDKSEYTFDLKCVLRGVN